jgi:hypothetical protein
VGSTQRRSQAPRRPNNCRGRADGSPRLHMPRSRPAACAESQQLIDKNRQPMSIFRNSATRAPSLVWLRARSPRSSARRVLCTGSSRARAWADGKRLGSASLFSEATARCWNQNQAEGGAYHSRLGVLPARSVRRWRYHRSDRERKLSLGRAGPRRSRSDEATEQGDEADKARQDRSLAAYPQCSVDLGSSRGVVDLTAKDRTGRSGQVRWLRK